MGIFSKTQNKINHYLNVQFPATENKTKTFAYDIIKSIFSNGYCSLNKKKKSYFKFYLFLF